jgi:ATP/maltotriose-dependent transcriptional regulator MalT
MRDGLAMFEGSRGNLRVSLFRAMIADACRAVGDAAAGLAEVDASILALRCLGGFGRHAYALIVRADLQQLAGAHDEAEASYREAIGFALAQAAKTWELRAATGLARLWHTQGKSIEARDLLVPTYYCFTEGFDMPDPRG